MPKEYNYMFQDEFELETKNLCFNENGEPNLDYVVWLETKLNESLKNKKDVMIDPITGNINVKYNAKPLSEDFYL